MTVGGGFDDGGDNDGPSAGRLGTIQEGSASGESRSSAANQSPAGAGVAGGCSMERLIFFKVIS